MTLTRSQKNKEIADEIIFEEQSKKAKTIIFTTLKIISIITLIISTSYITLRYIGNLGLQVKEYGVILETLPESFHGIKIVHFGDLHYGTVVGKEEVQTLSKTIQKINPDIIVFTGDLIDESYSISYEESEFLLTTLNNMPATIGKYAIRGEDDTNNFEHIINNSNFNLLKNESEIIYYQEAEPILLVGIDYDADYEKAFETHIQQDNYNHFTIVLTHQPDNTDSIINYTPDMILAGHSHNGQIRLPYIGSITKQNGAKTYDDSFYQINDTKLYITSGIGTSNHNFRLFNHPSINFFRLRVK